MRKDLLLSLILAATTSSAFAMPYEPSNHEGIFEIALTGAGFKAATDNTEYGIQAATLGLAPYTRLATSGTVLKNDPHYKFGGTLLLGYYFADSTINVDASYTGAHNSSQNSAVGTITPNLVPPTITGVPASIASSSYSFNYNFANIEIGSLTRVNCNGLIINPQVGLSFARIKSDQTVSYGGSPIPQSYIIELDSTFNGIGPSLGLDLNYIVCQPISLMSSFRYNALIGNIKSSYNLTNSQNDFMNIPFNSKNTVINLFQTDLAIGYDFNFSSMFCGNLAVGYQFTKSINSNEKIQFVDDAAESSFADTLLNTSLHGYFVRVSMDFDV